MLAQGLEPVPKYLRVSEVAVLAEEAQFTVPMRLGECLKKQTPEQARQYPYRQEEAGLASDPALTIGGKASARDNAVDVGMVGQGRSPGVQHQGSAYLRAQMFWINFQSFGVVSSSWLILL